MKARRRFTVRAHQPARVEALERLSSNLRWSWDSTTTPPPVAGQVGYTVCVLPHHPLLAADNELGLVSLA